MTSTDSFTYSITTLLFVSLAVYRTQLPTLPFDAVGPVPASSLPAQISRAVAFATSPEVLIAFALAGAFWAYETHHIHTWLHTALVLTTAAAVGWLVKEWLQVPRPADRLTEFASYSFPSLHATAVAGLFVVGRYHLTRLSLLAKKTVHIYGTVAVFMVFASRLLLGVHTISDVLAGGLLGVLLARLSMRILERAEERFGSVFKLKE